MTLITPGVHGRCGKRWEYRLDFCRATQWVHIELKHRFGLFFIFFTFKKYIFKKIYKTTRDFIGTLYYDGTMDHVLHTLFAKQLFRILVEEL